MHPGSLFLGFSLFEFSCLSNKDDLVNDSSWRWFRKSSYEMTNRVGNQAAVKLAYDAASKVGMMPQERPCMVSYCFHSSIIPQECGSGTATVKINQDGDDAASHPTRRRFKMAAMPQVVLPDNEWSRPWCRNSSYEMPIQVGNQASIKLAWCRNQSWHDAARKTLYGLILLS
jgi:hypothetical protein